MSSIKPRSKQVLLIATFAFASAGCVRKRTLNQTQWNAAFAHADRARFANGAEVPIESALRHKSSITTLVETNRVRGAFQGLGIGAGIGAAAFILGVAVQGVDEADFLDYHESIIIGAIYGAGFGAVLGVIAGTAGGARTEYTLATPNVYVLPKPDGGQAGLSFRF